MTPIPYSLSTRSLRFSYGRTPVLRGIDMQVPTGKIYGFLGPNGAGKTTLIRILAGLLGRFEGDVKVLGHDLPSGRLSVLSHTGFLIEKPSIYLHLSGRQNLKLQSLYSGAEPKAIAEMLHVVGLEHAADRKAGAYSMGMKQRLGMAMAILHKPRLLILDEPVNGLDPQGVKEVRALIKRLNTDYGMTILLSSHLLSEVEKTADYVGVLREGKLIYQGLIKNLSTAKDQRVQIVTSDSQLARVILQTAGFSCEISDAQTILAALPAADDIARANAALVSAGLPVFRLNPVSESLEEHFMKLLQEPNAK